MSKLVLAILITLLSGCASMGEWRTLNIDGTSEEVFGETLSRLNGELSYSKKQMLSMAIVDIASIGPITTETAEKLGFEVHITAESFTIPGLCQAILQHFHRR